MDIEKVEILLKTIKVGSIKKTRGSLDIHGLGSITLLTLLKMN